MFWSKKKIEAVSESASKYMKFSHAVKMGKTDIKINKNQFRQLLTDF